MNAYLASLKAEEIEVMEGMNDLITKTPNAPGDLMYRLLNAKLENTVKLLVWRNKILQGNLPNRIPDVITHLGYPYTDELEDAMGFIVALAEGRYEKDVKI